jgi:hypothetical protein
MDHLHMTSEELINIMLRKMTEKQRLRYTKDWNPEVLQSIMRKKNQSGIYWQWHKLQEQK